MSNTIPTIVLSGRYDQTNARRWIGAHLARYKPYVAIYLVGTLLWQGLTSAIPWATGIGFDALLQARPDEDQFLRVVVILLAIVLMRGLIGVSTTYALENIGNGVERDARDELYRSLLGKKQTFFDRRRVGDLTARAIEDARQVNALFQPGIEFLLIALYGTLVPIVFIAALQLELLLTPLLFLFVFVMVVRIHSDRLGPISDGLQQQFGRLNAHLTESIYGVELIESAGQKLREQQRFEQNARNYRDWHVQQGRIQASYLPPLLLNIALACGLLHGLLLVANGQMTAGDLVAYLGLLGLLGQPVEAFGNGLMLIRNGLSGTKRILELLADDVTQSEKQGNHHGVLQGYVTFENVTFGYGDISVLEDISFQIQAGETVALVGPTGSGKSTLTKLLNRTYDVDSGRILVDGVDLRTWNLGSLRSQTAVIEQEAILFSRSIAENIAFGAQSAVNQKQIEQAARAAQAHDFIMRFTKGYDTLIGEGGATLSGGQRQRLAIARALLVDPRILIMDDATSAVDSATEAEIQAAIHSLTTGRTTFLITHRLAQIKRADRILVFDRGQLAHQGTHDELLDRSALYRRIFATSA